MKRAEIQRWRSSTIGEMGEIVSGGTPSRTVPSFWNGNIPWATPTDITRLQDKYISNTAEKITENGLAGSSAHLLPAGSLLVTSRATLGEAAIATVPIATNQGFKSIVPNSETHRVFAYYLIKTLKSKMIPLASGTTFLEIGKGDFCRIPVQIPDFDEQARIAYVLDTIDEAIQKTEAVIAKLKQIRAGMLHDLLTYGLDKDGKLRDPVAHPEQFKDSELGRIPKEWETRTIEQLPIAILDGDRGSNYPNESQLFDDGYCVFLNNKNIKDGTFDLSSAQYITKERDALLRKGKLIAGDVVVTTRGTVGNIALYDRNTPYGHIRINSGMVILRHTETIFEPRLFVYVWRHLFPSEYHRLSSGSAQPQFPIRDMLGFRLILPPMAEQEGIVAMLLEVDSTIGRHLQEQVKLTKIKSGLMDDLLSGDVRVQEELLDVIEAKGLEFAENLAVLRERRSAQ